jgi:hypothetical protein
MLALPDELSNRYKILLLQQGIASQYRPHL